MILYHGTTLDFETPISRHHTAGYFDCDPIGGGGRWLLALASDAGDSIPGADDTAELMRYDMGTGDRTVIGVTGAFNWQMGARLQWLGADRSDKVIYNAVRNGQLSSVMACFSTNRETVADAPVYSVAPNGDFAITLNFSAIAHHHRSYGYSCRVQRPEATRPGTLTKIDLSGSFGAVEKVFTDDANEGSAGSLLEHAVIGPDSERVLFVRRSVAGSGIAKTDLLVANLEDTMNATLLQRGMVSHYAWMPDARRVCVFCDYGSARGAVRNSRLAQSPLLRPALKAYRAINKRVRAVQAATSDGRYCLFDVTRPDAPQRVFSKLVRDGHPSANPVIPDLIVSDTYQDGRGVRELYLADLKTGERVVIAEVRSHSASDDTGWRCDMHPRWDSIGRRVTIDVREKQRRQVCVVDASVAISRLRAHK